MSINPYESSNAADQSPERKSGQPRSRLLESWDPSQIQHWLQGETIPERSAQRIFAAADKILKAGIDRQQGGTE